MQTVRSSHLKRLGFVPTLSTFTGAALKPHHMAWSLVSPQEVFFSGPYLSGRHRLWNREVASGEQHNLVLDQAYEFVPVSGFSRIAEYAVVGSGVSSFSRESRGLFSEVARTKRPSSWLGRDIEVRSSGKGSYKITVYREFFEDEVGGKVLSEWGYSPFPTPEANLSVAERFLDVSGNPIAITVEPDQRLRMVYTYEVFVSPPRASGFSIPLNEAEGVSGVYSFVLLKEDAPSHLPLHVLDFLVSGSTREDLGEFRLYLYAHRIPVPPAPATLLPVQDFLRGQPSPVASKPVSLLEHIPGERVRKTAPVSFNPEDFSLPKDASRISIYSFLYGFPEGGLLFSIPSGEGIVVDGTHRLTFGPLSVSW